MRTMDITVPKLPTLPKIPAIATNRRQALIAVGAVIAVVAAAFIGWTLFTDWTESRQVAVFGSHVAASEADLARVSAKISSHMSSRPEAPSIAESDVVMREFAAIATYGQAVTTYHRRIIGADEVPEAYIGAQSAYIRALDCLNRAFSLWASAAAAYDAGAYTSAKDALVKADQAWKEYVAATGDYNRELRIAEEGEEAPPA